MATPWRRPPLATVKVTVRVRVGVGVGLGLGSELGLGLGLAHRGDAHQGRHEQRPRAVERRRRQILGRVADGACPHKNEKIAATAAACDCWPGTGLRPRGGARASCRCGRGLVQCTPVLHQAAKAAPRSPKRSHLHGDGRCGRDAGEMQWRCRRDAVQMQRRSSGDAVEGRTPAARRPPPRAQ